MMANLGEDLKRYYNSAASKRSQSKCHPGAKLLSVEPAKLTTNCDLPAYVGALGRKLLIAKIISATNTTSINGLLFQTQHLSTWI
jgi:hypothetical protein